MLCIKLDNDDPFFCLAAEEFLLRNFSDDIFMVWQSHNSVVVGKHQNLLAEVNYPFCIKNNIKLARRISGGGTVFHDAGNVNFTFIKNVAGPQEISFQRFTEPIRKALRELDIDAQTSGRNDLVVNGLKISGNAEHVYKNRVLHHGTLLFNSDLNNLGQALKVIPGKYQSKAVQSNPSPVANISSFMNKEMKVEDFSSFLFNFQLAETGNSSFVIQKHEFLQIETLAEGKFSTFGWRLGYSPPYIFKNSVSFGRKLLNLELSVKSGVIEECSFSGEYFYGQEKKLANILIGKKHIFDDVKEALRIIIDSPADDLVFAFF